MKKISKRKKEDDLYENLHENIRKQEFLEEKIHDIKQYDSNVYEIICDEMKILNSIKVEKNIDSRIEIAVEEMQKELFKRQCSHTEFINDYRRKIREAIAILCDKENELRKELSQLL